MFLFDGKGLAAEKEAQLQEQLRALPERGEQGPRLAALYFAEDPGSVLYSSLKQQAAERVGIAFELHQLSFSQSLDEQRAAVRAVVDRINATGVIIQKPWRLHWEQAQSFLATNTTDTSSTEDSVDLATPIISADTADSAGLADTASAVVSTNPAGSADSRTAFRNWWRSLVSEIPPEKDVDGLTRAQFRALKDYGYQDSRVILPATVKAILSILAHLSAALAQQLSTPEAEYLILNRSDILGQPLREVLKQQGKRVEMIGSRELQKRVESGRALRDKDVIISGTGRGGLITGELVKPGAALIDVGEPRPDVDRTSVEPVAGFLTPVPGGVGPLTVISLLENALQLQSKRGDNQ